MAAPTVIVLLVLTATAWAGQFSYEGYKVFRVNISKETDLKTLTSFRLNEKIDFCTTFYGDGKFIDVIVSPNVQTIFRWFLHIKGIKHTVVINNVETILKEERKLQWDAPITPQGKISFVKYHSFDEINAYLDQLAKDHSNILTLEKAGESYEGRDLKVVKISTGSSKNKPIIFIDAGIHAREWISPAQAVYIIQQLVENSTNANLLENVDWHILSLINPDGYEYSHTTERLWRKTRSPGKECYGVDGNRNFDFHWGQIGGTTDECGDSYIGPVPFSESETRAVKDYILKYKDSIKLYLTLHSAGEYLVYPWGFDFTLPDDHEELQALGEAAALSIRQVHGTVYTVGSSVHVLYPNSGGSDDWVKGVAGIELSYTIELSGRSCDFTPLPNDILDVVEETWEGIKTFHGYIEKKFT